MGYRIENKPINITGKKSLTKIVSDKTGDIYRYKNMAVKIFKEKDAHHFDQDFARHMTSIPTENILLPRKLVFYNNAFRGYTMKLVPKKGIAKKMIQAPKHELLSTIASVELDTEMLSSRHILLSGITPNNAFYNGELYIYNPSDYSILDLEKEDDLERINKFQIHLLLVELIVQEMRKNNYSQEMINRVREMLNIKDTDQNTSTYLEELIDGQDSIKQMIKKMR